MAFHTTLRQCKPSLLPLLLVINSIIADHHKTHSTTITKRLRTNSGDDNATNYNQTAAGDDENNRINPFHDNDNYYLHRQQP